MDDIEHFEFIDFMEEQELKINTTEANKELAEEINPTTQEINMDINIHKVKKIEMSKTRLVSDFYVRDITFHSLEYSLEKGDYVKIENKITLFLNEKESAKVQYAKAQNKLQDTK